MSRQAAEGVGAGVLEIVSDHRGDTFRAVYAGRLRACIRSTYVSEEVEARRGYAQVELEMIERRLKRAVDISEAGA